MLNIRCTQVKQHFLFLQDEHEVRSEVTIGVHPVILLRPSTPPPLFPPPWGIKRKVFIPLENFSFNLSFLCSSAGAKKLSFEGVQLPGACVSLWWMIYWCLSGMNRSKAVAWQAINQASNQGWQSQSGTQAENTLLSLSPLFLSFSFLSCFFFFWH